MPTNDEINARVSRMADLALSRACRVLSFVFAGLAVWPLWLARDACPLELHPCGFMLVLGFGGVLLALLCATVAHFVRPASPAADI
jgi:hypothetical protein